MKELPKAYEPQQYEDDIYKRWEDSGFFAPEAHPPWADNPDTREPYTIMMPPPNVTGVLHLGHALENSLMDTMIRYQRMKGKKALLVPGTDHSAVATQARVEANFIEEGIEHPREHFGREGLLKEIREYAEQSKTHILKQIKKMGTSADWSRLAYTFDEPRNVAVNTVFKKMYDDGLIYRGYRVVNWSVQGQSTCSDDELVHVERPAKLYIFKYSKDFPIPIATTRPETKVGDTAVAVNPNGRWKEYIGQEFTIENFGQNGYSLTLKVIGDEVVEDEFGTGALGVTTAHSPIDFDMYMRHKAAGNDIGLIPVIGKDGKMTSEAGSEYEGLTVEKAREKIVVWLRDAGLMMDEEEIVQNVGTSDRFKDVVEAIPMTQWFVDVNKEIPGRGKSLKQLMKDAVVGGLNGDKNKKVTITPERFEKVYFNWIDNLRDWCISRQIWWGHRIPVWYKKASKNTFITFVRHGESQVNVDNIHAGHLDSPLTETGRNSVGELKKKINFDKIDVVFSSDLDRAKETVSILFNGSKKEIITDKRLRGIDFGDYTGKKNDGSADKIRVIGFPNGESYHDVKRRVLVFLSDVLDKYSGKHIAIVAHSGTWKVLESIVHGTSLDQEFLKIHATREPIEYSIDSLVYVGVEAPEGDGWTQDSDTLDTWFSSGQWTFSTLGWPNETEDLKTYHPTNWMQMGYEILFFWMARMILFSAYTFEDIPFKDVYIHGMLRNKDGKKFSKSDKNGTDPIEMIDKYGTDALRMSLLSGNTPGNDSRFYEEKVENMRNLVNKLWNMSRFMLMNIDTPQIHVTAQAHSLSDKWILAELHTLTQDISQLIESYDFSLAAEKLREFTWSKLADWYLEIAKVESAFAKATADKGAKSNILNYILNTILKLWHPYMPFVTEAIWHEVYGDDAMLMVEKWPEGRDTTVVTDFDIIKNIITGIRSIRGDYKIDPVKKLNVTISAGESTEMIQQNAEVTKALARLDTISVQEKSDKLASAVGFVQDGIDVFIDLEGIVDFEKEKKRLTDEIKNVEEYVTSLDKKLSNVGFVDNAPADVVEQEQEKLAHAKENLEKMRNQLETLQ